MMRQLLRAALLCALAAAAAGRAGAAEIIDERVSLLPGGVSSATGREVMFAGQSATISGSAINGAGGATLYAAAGRVLDAASAGGADFVLTESALVMVRGKKSAAMPLGGVYAAGRLLHARPGFFVYYLTDADGATFFVRTPTETRMYFAAGKDFVAARIDEDANTVVATRDRIFSVDMSGRVTPLFDLRAEVVEGIELLAADNTVLLDTPNSLVKITPGGRFYTVLAGRGTLARLGDKYIWHDAERRQRFELGGLEQLGHPESDRAYARAALEQGRKLLALDLHEQAFKKFLHVLEIMPDEPAARELVLALGAKLYGKK